MFENIVNLIFVLKLLYSSKTFNITELKIHGVLKLLQLLLMSKFVCSRLTLMYKVLMSHNFLINTL